MSNADVVARLAALEARNAELEAQVAKSNASAAKRLQLNGHLTIPKGQKTELVGRSFEATIKVKGVFGTSKSSGNVSARLTSKVPFEDLVIAAVEAAPAE